jgi:UDP-N-acetylglucosamine diphosphorylase/glucosamine-1-phosphate N-acetyltransferase
VGYRTLREKWMDYLTKAPSYLTRDYLQVKYPSVVEEHNLVINAAVVPDRDLAKALSSLEAGQVLMSETTWIGIYCQGEDLKSKGLTSCLDHAEKVTYSGERQPRVIGRPWHILSLLTEELVSDIEKITKGCESKPLSSSNRVIGSGTVFVEESVTAECCIFNTTSGPIYLGKNSEVMEGSMIRGPFALGEGSTINMGAKIYGPVSVGPRCKVGGEVKGTIFFGNANKGHDGFVGDSIIGEWCNLGADTNTSNLKNNYLPVRVWSYVEEKFVDTGLQFCGLIMGDHTKTGINTMLNTGTVTGAYSNIFGEGYPRNFIPSFAWGGASGFSTHPLKKALETAEIVMARRKVAITEEDRNIARHIMEMEAKFRVWEKG